MATKGKSDTRAEGKLIQLLEGGMTRRSALAACNLPDDYIETEGIEAECLAAEARFEERNLSLLRRAADAGDLGAAKWLLEHVRPDKYGAKGEQSGDEGIVIDARVEP